MLSFSLYTAPIYAALILSILGMGSSVFWRLHATMGVLSLLTLSAVIYFFTTYPMGEDTKLVTSFIDIFFGAAVAVVLVKYEATIFSEEDVAKGKRLYIYYTVIMIMLLSTSLLNFAAWHMDYIGVYEGSYFEKAYNNIILTANIIQVLCLIEGGANGSRNIINIINSNFSRLRNSGNNQGHAKDGRK